jgi:hypothetical protein
VPLWRFTLELPDGTEVTNVLRAGNRDGAEDRLERWARRRDASIVAGPERVGS